MEEALRLEFEQVASESWSVFADRLQEQGDPRGRLIALEQKREAYCMEAAQEAGEDSLDQECDLLASGYVLYYTSNVLIDACHVDACQEESDGVIHEIEALGEEIDALYQAHKEAWLGGLAARLDSDEGSFRLVWRFGYLQTVYATHYEEKDLQLLAALLDLPSARFVCELREEANTDSMQAVVDALAAQVRPWRRCSITYTGGTHSSDQMQPVGSDEAGLGIRLATALPHLEELSLMGHGVFSSFPHPTLKKLTMSGISIRDFGVATDLPALHHLDIAIHQGGFESTTLTEQVCSGSGLPSLRTLDLSRNIMRCGTGADPVFDNEVLFQSPLLGRIEHLILPPLYSKESADKCVKHASLLQAIAKVELPLVLTHHYDPRAVLLASLPAIQVGPPYHFRLQDEVHGREAIAIQIHGEGGHWFSYNNLSGLVQEHFDSLGAASQKAITRLMHAFDEIHCVGDGEPESALLPLQPVFDAFQELGETTFEDGDLYLLWDYVCSHIECCTSVLIKKTWGW